LKIAFAGLEDFVYGDDMAEYGRFFGFDLGMAIVV
jgi:hypothetical protein